MSKAKACFAADIGFNEIHVEARPGDVMAGAGGGGGSCAGHTSPTSWYTIENIYYNYCIDNNDAASTVVKACWQSAQDSDFEPRPKHLFPLCSMYIKT